jgi:hypothetical protein
MFAEGYNIPEILKLHSRLSKPTLNKDLRLHSARPCPAPRQIFQLTYHPTIYRELGFKVPRPARVAEGGF